MTPKFSIIIPTYNSAKTLQVCLNSILEQSFSDFEVLLIDGVSSEGTIAIIKNYAQLNEKIHWVSEKDSGIYDAMNKGIKLAKGKWLYFLGSDDHFYNSDVLKLINENIEQDFTFDVIYGNVISPHFNGIYDGEFTNEKIFKQNICHQAVFIKRSVFKQIGVFNKRYKGFADWDHNMRWFLSLKIRKKYLDIIIANYGEGGFTSLNWDSVFGNEKQFNYLLYGHKSLSFKYKITALTNEFVKVKSILSHMATSDDATHYDFARYQIDLFEKLSLKLIHKLQIDPIRHILNTSGISNYPDAQYDMVRLGIGIYGVSNDAEEQRQLENVSILKSIISQIRTIETGESVGYGRRFIAEDSTKIATIPIGYADGISRAWGNSLGFVTINGQKATIVGSICMDMLMVDVSKINCNEGDEVIIFGNNPTVTFMSNQLNTIPYEILTGISQRVKRVFYRE